MISKVRSTNKLIWPKLSIDPLRGYCPLMTIFHNLFIIFANFKKSSPLKLLNQIQPNFNWMISRVYKINSLFCFLFRQKAWPSWLKIEHRVKCSFWLISQKLQHLEQIRQEVKVFIRSRSTCPEIFSRIG